MELVRTQVKRDGTTGLPIDAVADEGYRQPPSSLSSTLRNNVGTTTAINDLSKDEYLEIPAFLRRQAD